MEGMQLWIALGGAIVAPSGAAWAAVKITLNSAVKRIVRIEDKVDNLSERVARMEGQHEKVAGP